MNKKSTIFFFPDTAQYHHITYLFIFPFFDGAAVSTRKLQCTIHTRREQRRLNLTKDLRAESERIRKLRQVQSVKMARQCRNHSEQQLRQVFCLYFNVSLLKKK